MTTNTIRNFEIWVETKKKIRVDVKKKNASRVTETADHLNSWRRDEVIVQKAREMSHACRSVFTISSASISSFFGRKMSSDLQDIVRRVVENLSNIQPANSAATSSSEGCQNFTNETEVQELNQCFQVPRLPAPNSSVLQQSSGRDLAAGFSSRQNYSSPDSRECAGKFQDLLLGAFSLMLEISVRVAAIATLSNRHITSRMFVFFSTLLGKEYLVEKWRFSVSTKKCMLMHGKWKRIETR